MRRKITDWLFFGANLAFVFLLIACSHSNNRKEQGPMTVQLTSSTFSEGGIIPTKYTCDGEDISPDLKWRNIPNGTKSLALVCDDPDAPVGTFVHWVIYNIPLSVTELPAGIPTTEGVASGAKQGINDFGQIGYGGPCPPPGKPHRYFFKLYALDAEINLKAGVKKEDLVKTMEGHILAQGQLMGTYQRAN